MARVRRLARDYKRLSETLVGLHFVAFAILLAHRFITFMAKSIADSITLACGAVALLTFQLGVRQRAWWLWLLGLYGEDTVELRWTWRVAGWFGLRKQEAHAALKPSKGKPSQHRVTL